MDIFSNKEKKKKPVIPTVKKMKKQDRYLEAV